MVRVNIVGMSFKVNTPEQPITPDPASLRSPLSLLPEQTLWGAQTIWNRLTNLLSRERGSSKLTKTIGIGILATAIAVGGSVVTKNSGSEDAHLISNTKVMFHDGDRGVFIAKKHNKEHPSHRVSGNKIHEVAQGQGKFIETGTIISIDIMSDGDTEVRLIRDPNNDND